MVGGDRAVAESLQPCWEAMGKTIVYQGGPGTGQHTKLVNQIVIAGNMVGICEALLYGYRAGLDLEAVMQSISSGAAGSWSLSNLAPRIIANRFEPGFFVEHFIKDMGIVLEESEAHGPLPAGACLGAPALPVAGRLGATPATARTRWPLRLANLSGIDWKGRGAKPASGA